MCAQTIRILAAMEEETDDCFALARAGVEQGLGEGQAGPDAEGAMAAPAELG